MKNKLSIFLICILIAGNSLAQEVTSSAGETQTTSGYEVSWTLGETVIETFNSGSEQLTQGFHQTKLIITALNESEVSKIDIRAYPNPTSDYVIVHFNENYLDSRILLFDLAGRKLQESIIVESDTWVNMETYSGGTYVLKLFDNNNQSIQNFKIVKR